MSQLCLVASNIPDDKNPTVTKENKLRKLKKNELLNIDREYSFYELNDEHTKLWFCYQDLIDYERDFYKALLLGADMTRFIIRHYPNVSIVKSLGPKDVALPSEYYRIHNEFHLSYYWEQNTKASYYPFYLLLYSNNKYEILSVSDIKNAFLQHYIPDGEKKLEDGRIVTNYRLRKLRLLPEHIIKMKMNVDSFYNTFGFKSSSEFIDFVHKEWYYYSKNQRGKIDDIKELELKHDIKRTHACENFPVNTEFEVLYLGDFCRNGWAQVYLRFFHYGGLYAPKEEKILQNIIDVRGIYPKFRRDGERLRLSGFTIQRYMNEKDLESKLIEE